MWKTIECLSASKLQGKELCSSLNQNIKEAFLTIWFRALAEIVTSFVSLATSKEHPASLPHLKAKQTNKQTVIEWLDNTAMLLSRSNQTFFFEWNWWISFRHRIVALKPHLLQHIYLNVYRSRWSVVVRNASIHVRVVHGSAMIT